MAVPSHSSASLLRRWHTIYFPVDSLNVTPLSLSVFCWGQATVCVSAVAASCNHQTTARQHSRHHVSRPYLWRHTSFPSSVVQGKLFHSVEGNILTNTPSLSPQQIDLQRRTTGSHEGKGWCRNTFRGNRTFQQCFHTFAAVITAGTKSAVRTTSWNMKVSEPTIISEGINGFLDRGFHLFQMLMCAFEKNWGGIWL